MLVENQERWNKTCFNEMDQKEPHLSGALSQEPTITNTPLNTTKVNNKAFSFSFCKHPL